MACVNKALPQYKELADKFGDNIAESLVVRNNYEIPTEEEAIKMLRGNKVIQFKQGSVYLKNATSADVDKLLANFNHIMYKGTDADIYLVKGSKLGVEAAPFAKQEIEQPNIQFLNQLNQTYPGLFTVSPAFTETGTTQNREQIAELKGIKRNLDELQSILDTSRKTTANNKTLIRKMQNLQREYDALNSQINSKDKFQKLPQESFNTEVVNGFYSPIEKRIGDFKQDKASATKWKEIVGKGDEATFTGVNDYLNSLKPDQQISKKDIYDFMKNNRIKVEPVVLGTNDAKRVTESNITKVENKNGYFQVYFDNGAKIPFDKNDYAYDLTKEQAIQFAIDDVNESLTAFAGGKTKYEKYTEPGEKSNYQEVLITLPNKHATALEEYNKSFDDYNAWLDNVNIPTEEENNKSYEWVKRNKELKSKLPVDTVFQSGRAYLSNDGITFTTHHFDEPNIAVHLRTDLRTDSEGKKVLFIEENQSDWGQLGKKKGFGKSEKQRTAEEGLAKIETAIKDTNNKLEKTIQKMRELGLQPNSSSTELRIFENGENAETRKLEKQLDHIKTNKEYDAVKNRIDELSTAMRTAAKERRQLLESVKALEDRKERFKSDIQYFERNSDTVAEAPFVTDTNAWVKLGLKHALQQAVQVGADKIAWTNGDQQNSRYDLSKQVRRISVGQNKNGLYEIDAVNAGDEDHAWHKIASDIHADQIENYVGKEIAKKAVEGQVMFEGVDLKVGGKGMIGFYGDPSSNKLGIVGNVAKSLFKQEPEITKLKTSDVYSASGHTYDKKITAQDVSFKDGQVLINGKFFANNMLDIPVEEKIKQAIDYYNEAVDNNSLSSQHSITITPELRAEVEKGLPLFQKVPGRNLFNDNNSQTKVIADQYKQDKGITIPDGVNIYKLDTNLSKRIADAYEAMKDNPNDPEVHAAYQALANETVDQFDYLSKAGYNVELYDGEGEPYKNSQDMIDDIKNNNHQYTFSTEKGFGKEPITNEQRNENPLLQDSDRKDINGKPLLVNDVFRFVYDFFGHSERGNGFGPVGEENAWDVHSRMYSDLARRAMTTETRGQNSWVNFGKHLRGENGELINKGEPNYVDIINRPFAEQKIGLLPEEFSQVREVPENAIDNKVNIDENVLSDIAQKNQANQSLKAVNDVFGAEEDKSDQPFPEDKERVQHRNYAVNNVTRMLTDKYGIQFEAINDADQRWRGKFSNGKVILNEAYVNPDTPFHELFHGFADVLEHENSALFNNLLNELRNSDEGKVELERVAKEYSELTGAEQEKEALVSLLGKKAADNLMLPKTVWGQFLDWLKSVLSGLGIRTTGFDPNMSINDFSKLIIDPLHSFDLDRAIKFEQFDEQYQKVPDVDTQLTFDSLIKETVRKLTADAAIPGKTNEEKTRKYFSKKNAELLKSNSKDVENLDKYILSALTNLKSITTRMDEFKQVYSSKKVKSKADVIKLSSLLHEIDDNVTLYNTVSPLIDSMTQMFPDDETNFGNLKNNLKRQNQLINDYKLYGATAVADWLYPYMNKAVKEAKSKNNIFTVVSKDVYNSVRDKLNTSGVTDPNIILEHAVKEDVKQMLLTAKQDASAVTTYLGAILTSRDPITAAVGLALSDETMKALKEGHHTYDNLQKLLKDHRGNTLFTSNDQERQFHEKYLRKVKSWEYQSLDKDLNPVYKYVDRTAFHEEHFMDTFYNNKREDFANFNKSIGLKEGEIPSKFDTVKWNAYKQFSDNWWNNNAIKVIKNGKDSFVPADKYKNPQFPILMQDKYYAGLYNEYKKANDKTGGQGLKFGIIPQDRVSGLKIDKASLKPGNVLDVIKKGLGEEEQVYYSENIDGFQRQTVPISYTHLLDDEKGLSFNLANSVAKFSMSAGKYDAISSIEPHVKVLNNFIEGNTALGIDPRKAFQKSSGGIKSLVKGERTAMPIEAKNLNKQLNGFINDVVYGHSLRKEVIQMWDAKFTVKDKANPTDVKTIHGFGNLQEHLNTPELDYHGFEVGKEREVGDKIATLVRKDQNFSVKKAANKLGLLTAMQLMVLNPVSAVINLLRGKIDTYTEATGGKFFNLKEHLKGDAEYVKSMFNGDFINDLKGGKPSFFADMNMRYENIQGELQDPYGKKLEPGVANKLFRRSHLFFLQNGGEHQIQTSMMAAMMMHQKVELNSGKEISLYDARRQEYEGKLKFSDVKWSDDDDRGFKEKLNAVNKQLNGNYDKLDKAFLQCSWWGQQLMMFRKHLYNGFANRYRKGYVDYGTGNYTQGYYRTFFSGLTREIGDMVMDGKLRKFNLTDEEKYAFRKLGADAATLGLMMVAFKLFDDDDQDNEITDSFALVARRLMSEGVQYTPVVGTFDLARIVANPTASSNVVEQYYNAIKQTVTDPTAEYDHSGPGYQEGQNKAKVYWGRLVPAWRQYVNAVEPERMLQYYQKNSIWFLKPSAGKKQEANVQ